MTEQKRKLHGQASCSHAGCMLGNLPHETAICRNPHNSSDLSAHITSQMVYKYTLSKCCVHKKIACLDFFTKNLTCLSAGLLRIDKVLYVSCKTV